MSDDSNLDNETIPCGIRLQTDIRFTDTELAGPDGEALVIQLTVHREFFSGGLETSAYVSPSGERRVLTDTSKVYLPMGTQPHVVHDTLLRAASAPVCGEDGCNCAADNMSKTDRQRAVLRRLAKVLQHCGELDIHNHRDPFFTVHRAILDISGVSEVRTATVLAEQILQWSYLNFPLPRLELVLKQLTRSGHIFCVPCIERWIEEERQRSRSPLVKCPVCRHAFHTGITTSVGVPYEFRPFCMPALRKIFLEISSRAVIESALVQAEAALRESEAEKRAALHQIEEMRLQAELCERIRMDAQREMLRLSAELRAKEEFLVQQQHHLGQKEEVLFTMDGQLRRIQQQLEAMTITNNEQESNVHKLEQDLTDAREKVTEQAKTIVTLSRQMLEKDAVLSATTSANSAERVSRTRQSATPKRNNHTTLDDTSKDVLSNGQAKPPAESVSRSEGATTSRLKLKVARSVSKLNSPPTDLLDAEDLPRYCTNEEEHEWTRQGTNHEHLEVMSDVEGPPGDTSGSDPISRNDPPPDAGETPLVSGSGSGLNDDSRPPGVPAAGKKRAGSPLESATKKKQQRGVDKPTTKRKPRRKTDSGSSKCTKGGGSHFESRGGFWFYQPHGQQATQTAPPPIGHSGYFHAPSPFYPPFPQASYGPHPPVGAQINYVHQGLPVPTPVLAPSINQEESAQSDTDDTGLVSGSDGSYGRSDRSDLDEEESMDEGGRQSEADVSLLVDGDGDATPRASVEPEVHHKASQEADKDASLDQAADRSQRDDGGNSDERNLYERTPRASPGPSTVNFTQDRSRRTTDMHHSAPEIDDDADDVGIQRHSTGKGKMRARDDVNSQFGLVMLDSMHSLQKKLDDQQRRQDEQNEYLRHEMKELRAMQQNHTIRVRNEGAVHDLKTSRSRKRSSKQRKPDTYKGLSPKSLHHYVRAFFKKLNGWKFKHELPQKNPPFSEEARRLYEHKLPGAPVVSLENWRLDFQKGWEYAFNQEAALLFTKRFLDELKQGKFQRRTIPVEHRTRDAVMAALNTHFDTLKRTYHEVERPLPPERLTLRAKRAATRSRQSTLLDNRKKTVLHRGYYHHTDLLDKFEPRNVSGDETDGEERSHPPKFRVVESSWMSPQLKTLFGQLDAEYREDYRNPHNKRATPGNPPRVRIRENARVESGVAPKESDDH
ncbi:hypothetical protein NM688_g4053 [Phlebia brevispora]|uniref:Uncharacterized protein n=1 Tax=Phlebia brevispora TaxID=194682 RepID=A0ACC1T3Q9_9APHY|nr:hypothetical protein NM688_g4053 [Phlebia brevispora]